MRGHGGAQRGDDLAAQDDVLLDGGVAQVEVAVLQALRLVGLAAAVDLEGEGVVAAAAEHLNLRGHDLDLARGLLGVLARALAHGALDGDGGLLVEVIDNRHHLLGLHDDLGRAVEVAQDDEGEVLSDDADVFHPADELDGLARIGQPQLPAGVGTHLHHRNLSCLDCKLYYLIIILRGVFRIWRSGGGMAHRIGVSCLRRVTFPAREK